MSKIKYSQLPCIICHRVTSGLYQSYKKKALEVLKSFFPLFESYVDDNQDMRSLGVDPSGQIPFQQVPGAEILPCPDCLRLVQSFCEWHEQLKSIEKMLNVKVEKLQSLMLTARRTPSIQNAFRDSAKQTNRLTDKGVDSILAHKDALIRKCDRKLKRAVPSLPSTKSGPKIISVIIKKVSPSSASSGNPELPGLASNSNAGMTSTTNRLGQRKRKRGQLNSVHDEEIDSEQECEDPTQLGNDESSFDSTIVKEQCDSDQGSDSDSKTGHPLSDHVKQEGKVDGEESDIDEMSPRGVNVSSPSPPTTSAAPKPSLQNGNLVLKCVKISDSEPRKHECKKCGKLFTRNEGLLAHMRTIHLKLREHFCDICGKDFGLLGNLQYHMKTVHANSREHLCNQCGKGYPTARTLRRHVTSTHSEAGEFPCDLCGKVYSTSFSLHCHRRGVHKQKRKNSDSGT